MVERDTGLPGVFMLARQRPQLDELTLPVPLFSVITGRRTTHVSELQVRAFHLRHRFGPRIAKIRRPTKRAFRRQVVAPVWRRLPNGARVGIKRVLRRTSPRRG